MQNQPLDHTRLVVRLNRQAAVRGFGQVPHLDDFPDNDRRLFSFEVLECDHCDDVLLEPLGNEIGRTGKRSRR